jgi:hypothetical protein
MEPAAGMTCELVHTRVFFCSRTSPISVATDVPSQTEEFVERVVAAEQCRDLREEGARREGEPVSIAERCSGDHRVTDRVKRPECPGRMPGMSDEQRGRHARSQQLRRKSRFLVGVA